MDGTDVQKLITAGSPQSPIWAIGEAPGEEEAHVGIPFVGKSGQEFNRLLRETGFNRNDLFITNVCHERPPANDINAFFFNKTNARHQGVPEVSGKYPAFPVTRGLGALRHQIALHQPSLILALGNTALWALTGLWGIGKWRGSTLPVTTVEGVSAKLVPTFHPAAILREWGLRRIVLQDLRRARREAGYQGIRKPRWEFIPRPTVDQVLDMLESLSTRAAAAGKLPLVCDIETRGGHIACVGLAWSKTEALCIPLMKVEGDSSYWSFSEEYSITLAIRRLLTHPNTHVIWQNGAYDLQYFSKEWGYLPNYSDDTMLMQHTAFPAYRKGLDFLSSMYCEYHRYWKDDGKEWDPQLGELSSWLYNCEDCVRTYECWEALTTVLTALGLRDQYEFQSKHLAPQVIRMSLRGIRVDRALRSKTKDELEEAILKRLDWLKTVLGHPLNPASIVQMKTLFYEDLGCPVIMNKKTRTPTLDDEALDKIQKRHPLLKPLLGAIGDIRSARTVLANTIAKPVHPNGRAYSSINLTGASTYRFSSSRDVFGFGGNMQNLSKGADEDPNSILPNLRKMFVPDPGYTLFEADLQGADARAVAWEANDTTLKEAFRTGVDIHAFNAETIWKQGAPLDEYRIKPALKLLRHRAKTACHAVNYGCKARTLADHISVSEPEANRFIDQWLQVAHPAIWDWHKRIEKQLERTSSVSNVYGYRVHFADRPDGLLPKALAWIGQSTTAITINKALVQLAEQVPEAEILLQIHDSILFQIPSADLTPALYYRLGCALSVTPPYPDPFTMPYELQASTTSWGDMAPCHSFQIG